MYVFTESISHKQVVKQSQFFFSFREMLNYSLHFTSTYFELLTLIS